MSDNPTDHESTAAKWSGQLNDQDLLALVTRLQQRLDDMEEVLHNLRGRKLTGR